jgi:hypothetical protein
MKKKLRRLVAITMVAIMGVTLCGCYGSFNMTKKFTHGTVLLEANLFKKLFFLVY